jgi:hypothetical protein
MADRKISDLTALTTPASGDFLPIVDISEAAAASKNKRITIEELMRGVPDGTAAAPGIAFETDPNTGIYSPGADQLAVATNGTGRLFIAANGKIGVGVSGPAETLDVAGNVQIKSTSVSGSPYLIFNSKEGSGGAERTVGQIQAIAESIDGWGLRFFTRPNGASITERFRVTSGGNVGIGTSAPDGLLTVRPTSGNAQIFIRTNDTTSTSQLIFGDSADSNVGGIQYNHTTDSLQFHVGNIGEKMTLDSLGKLGIGTTSPSFKLHISGTGNSGAILTEDTTAATSLYFNPSFTTGVPAVQTGTNHPLAFATNNVERARIDTSGRLLVGTSTSTNNLRFDQKLAVVSTGSGNPGGLSLTSYPGGASNEGNAPVLDLESSIHGF